MQFLTKFSTRFSNGRLLFHNWEEYGKSKTIGLIVDYLIIFAQIWWGRLDHGSCH